MTLTLDRCEIESVGSDPERLASALLKQLPDVTAAIPVEEIALALDIEEIVEARLTSIEACLQTDRLRSRGQIVVRAGARTSRRRWSVGHELGHFLNERHVPTHDGRFACTAADLGRPFGAARHVRQEREANAFAAAVLLPEAGAAPLLRRAPDLDHVLALAERFDVSREAASRRYVDLHREILAVVFAKDGRVRYAHRPDNFPSLRINRGDPLGEAPAPSSSKDRITGMDEIDAESWLWRGSDYALYAQTMRQADQRATILLLAEPRVREDEDLPRFRR